LTIAAAVKSFPSTRIGRWEILHKKPNQPHEFFFSGECTAQQALDSVEKDPNCGRVLHIREPWSFNFKTFDDENA
tara:strand:- start:6085 stop:6309 length:225 start_codon:yes stop_codon:yes gene_type:complete